MSYFGRQNSVEVDALVFPRVSFRALQLVSSEMGEQPGDPWPSRNPLWGPRFTREARASPLVSAQKDPTVPSALGSPSHILISASEDAPELKFFLEWDETRV